MDKDSITNADFLQAVFHTLPESAAPVVAAFPDDPKTAPPRAWRTYPARGQLPGILRPGTNQYFAIASVRPDDRGRYTRTHPAAVHCLVVDDIGVNGKVDPETIALEPSWELETSPDNCQWGYILAEPLTDLDLAARAIGALKTKGYTDPNGNNPVRLVRLPQGTNTKASVIEDHGSPFPCELHIWEPERRYSLPELIAGLGLTLAAPTPQSPGNAHHGAHLPPAANPALSNATHGSHLPAANWNQPRARKLAWDAARRTHDNPSLGRHEEVVKLGAYAARDGFPPDALEFILAEFASQMRPTDTTGAAAPMNWEAELRAIRDGWQRGSTEPRLGGTKTGNVQSALSPNLCHPNPNENNAVAKTGNVQSALSPNLRHPPSPDPPRPLLRLVDLSNLGSVKVPPPEFVVPQLIPRGEVTLLGSHGGLGKTMLALLVAACLATGRSFGATPIPPGRALVVSLEDRPLVVLHRLQRIVEDQKMPHDLIANNITVLDGSDADVPLATEISEFGIRRLALAPALAEIASRADGYDLIVIDNASDAFDGDENSRRQVKTFTRALAQVGRRANAGVLLLVHIDKSGARYGSVKNSYSGSTAWHNGPRSRLALTQDEKGLALIHEKSNHGREADPLPLEWNAAHILVPITPGAAEERHQRDVEAVFDAITKANAANDIVPAVTTGKRTAHKALTPHLPDHLRTGAKTRVDGIIERLARDGRIARATYKTPDYKTRDRWISANPPMCANGELFT